MTQERTPILTFLTLPEIDQVGDGKEHIGVWYDWFCTDKALVRRGRDLVSKLKQIQYSKRFNPVTTYVFFKNNCPVSGELYDDFRICDIKTGNVIFTIVPKSGHYSEKGQGCVWGKDDKGEFCELFSGSWKEIKKWFNDFMAHDPHYHQIPSLADELYQRGIAHENTFS